MALDIILGLQWGDEGKGKIVDYLSKKYDIIVRFQGGANAGHTVEYDGEKHILHLLPSGIFYKDTINVIANGVVIDPVAFKEEVEEIRAFSPGIRKRLYISEKAHLILPTHKILDAAIEKFKGKNKIGSTLRGIGPAYTDKIARNGLRVGDIFKKDFYKQFYSTFEFHQIILEKIYNFRADYDFLANQWLNAIEYLRNFQIISTEYFLNEALNNGKEILAEGAQGTLLDINFGTYPYVTSSNTISASANIGMGVPFAHIRNVYGVFKSYTTRVGAGPFPTEQNNEIGEYLRKKGSEYGATTGRPRRCGWLDIIALKYAVMINGVNKLIITKTDVLSGLEKIKIATAYKIDEKITEYFPSDLNSIQNVIYEEFNGWQKNISQYKQYQELPENLKKYIDYIEKQLNIPIVYISTGSSRESLITK